MNPSVGLIFLTAGRLDWTWGWAILAVIGAFLAAHPIILIPINPELLAEREKGVWDRNVKAWDVFTAACKIPSWLGLDMGRVEVFSAWLAGNGYPPVHHSERYRRLYRPAYRLVTGDFNLQEWIGNGKALGHG